MPKLQATQTSILSYEKLNPGTTTYHKTVGVEIDGVIDEKLFKEALLLVMKRHAMLRSRLVETENTASFECIEEKDLPNDANWPLVEIDATTDGNAPIEILDKTLEKQGKKDFFNKPFELDKEPMWRAAMVKLSATKHQFALLFHHLIADETSIGVILNDISTVYNALAHNKQPNLLSIDEYQSKDISLPTKETENRLAYWRTNLADLTATKLEVDKPVAGKSHSGKRHYFKLHKKLISQLKTTFPNESLNTIFISAFYALLHRYTGEADISIGTTSINRGADYGIPKEVMGQLVNAYFNSLPVRVDPDSEDSTFANIVAIVKQNLELGLQNQLPHDEILHHALPLNIRAGLPTAALFNFMLTTNGVKPSLNLEGTTCSQPVEFDLGNSKFEGLGINCDEQPDGSCACFLEFNDNRFTEDKITQLVSHFGNILEFAVDHPNAQLADIPMLMPQEVQKIESFNNTSVKPVYTGTLVDLMHSNAASDAATSPVVVYHREDGQKESITYGDMEIASNKIASYVQHIDKSNAPIAICLSRSTNLMKATFAAFKTGRPLVMIDPNDAESVEHILGSVNPSLVIVDNNSHHLFKDKHVKHLNLENTHSLSKIRHFRKTYPPPTITADSIAYIMHTSGTTSKPKMVRCTHGAVLNLINSLMQDPDHQMGTKVFGTAPATFDGFLYDIFLALAKKGQVHFACDNGRLTPSVIEKIIMNEKIDFAAFTAETLGQLDEKDLPIKRVISMGSMANENTLARWTNAGKHVENDIGHTETGIQLSMQRYKVGDNCAFIGKPINNMQMLILDAHGNICPPGARGELFVAGPGVAVDYLNNPELTQKKFRYAHLDANQQKYTFTDKPDATSIRLYATGDCCTYVDDKKNGLVVKFICRQDDYVKIHGIRVETNEVRQIIAQHPLVKNVIIRCTNDADPCLVAYILPTKDISLKEMRRKLNDYLATTHLPGAARPKMITLLNDIPLNKHGKLNPALLPLPIVPKHALTHKSDSGIPAWLIDIWAAALEIDASEVDLTKTIREMGGDSQALGRLDSKLNHSPDLRRLMGIKKNEKIVFNFLFVDMSIYKLKASLTALALSRPSSLQPVSLFSTSSSHKEHKNKHGAVNSRHRTSGFRSYKNI